MKIGIITDIHSNIEALNVTLKRFKKEKVDKIICCGDIVGIGINPEETVQALIKLKDILISVRGNHEKYLLEGLPKTVHDDNRGMSEEEINNHKWNQSKLSKESKEFLKEMKYTRIIKLAGKTIYITHYSTKEDGSYKKINKTPNIEESKEMFNNIDADIYLYGHTHTYSVNNDNNKWYINTGSLGCPNESNIAQSGIIDINNDKITFKRVTEEYNVEEIVEEIKKIKFPFYKKILQIFYGTKI